MAIYLDTGSGEPNQCVGHWLDENLVAGIQGFRGQFGYFRFTALTPYAGFLRDAATIGHPVHIVLGSNGGSLAAEDIQRVLRVVAGPAAAVTVVAFMGAEFHPKTIHITRADGTNASLVGSSNFTENGLGRNVEASIVLDELLNDDPATIRRVAECVERWRDLAAPGVFQIETDADIQSLTDAGIINLPQPAKPRLAIARATRSMGLGRRDRLWAARSARGVPSVTAIIPRSEASKAIISPRILPAQATIITHKWCKKLASSDAQQVGSGTNPTGKLRLTQSRFDIDHQRWFRNEMFGSLDWSELAKNGNRYEQATVSFSVRVRGTQLGNLNLRVDHAPHRAAGQSNVPTILAWGPQLIRLLTTSNYIGDWVVIVRDVSGKFTLTIQSHMPLWAP